MTLEEEQSPLFVDGSDVCMVALEHRFQKYEHFSTRCSCSWLTAAASGEEFVVTDLLSILSTDSLGVSSMLWLFFFLFFLRVAAFQPPLLQFKDNNASARRRNPNNVNKSFHFEIRTISHHSLTPKANFASLADLLGRFRHSERKPDIGRT